MNNAIEKLSSASEVYLKENNLLQLCLFDFSQGEKKTRTEMVWSDNNEEYALICDCSLGVPGAFEQDVYAACMRIWVKQGMRENKITITYSEIARELGLNPKNWVTKIKKALHKLGHARYHLKKCFIRAKAHEQADIHFSLFNTAALFQHGKGKAKRNSESILEFPQEILENIEANYYQRLDLKCVQKFTKRFAAKVI